jgi:NAD(P)H-hydrate epimerase
LRFIDLNFFAPSVRDAVLRAPPAGDAVDAAVLRREVLTPSAGFVVGGGILRRPPRPANGEKRAHGHLLLVGGSVAMPGAILMCVAAALRSGVGLVTACVPAPVCSTAAAALPEAMWVPVAVCPETGEMRDADAVLAAASSKKCTAMLVGPGVGRSSDETTAFLCRLVGECEAPVVALDADALQPPVVAAAVRAAGPQRITIVTPHAGEAKRVLAGVAAAATGTSEAKGAAVGGADVNDAVIGTAVRAAHGIFVQKSHRTWVHFLGSAAAEPDAPAHQGAGEREGRVCKALCPHGGPVLSRGGSGDLLAGLIAGAAAAAVAAVGSTAAAAVPRAAYDGVVEATLRAVCEHGAAADAVAEARGEAHAQVTDILSHL